MPPRAAFHLKHRPKGLEFPSCETCNSGTRSTDQVVALISRISPDDASPEGKNEIRKYLQAVANNVPGLLEEMVGPADWRQTAERRVGPGMHPLYTAGPLVSEHMERFAAKFGFAMHFEQTGRHLPPGGAVAARWYTNSSIWEGTFPQEAWEVLGDPATLRQGKFEVADQFEYAWASAEDGSLGMFLGTFRHAFAVLAISSVDRGVFVEAPAPLRIWGPGDLVR